MLNRVLALVFGLLPLTGLHAQALIEKYQAGKHYFMIEPAQTTSSGDKIEVLEVFSYACIHCAEFQPRVEEWQKRKSPQAAFALMPAVWNAPWEMMGRAYYAAEILGLAEQTHSALFKSMWVDNFRPNSMDDIAGWYVEHGGDKTLTKEKFLSAATSFAVDTKIGRSKNLVPKYGVDGTPTVIVAGKYRITGASAGAYESVFDVVDFLVAKELAARPAAKPAAAPAAAAPAKPAAPVAKPAPPAKPTDAGAATKH